MEEKNLTDKEIVKALTCKKEIILEEVNRTNNSVDDLIVCVDAKVVVGALDLIHRLQDDYSNLKERYVKVLGLNEKVIAEQKAEIERLTEDRNQLALCNKGLQDGINEYQADNAELGRKNAELQKQVDELKDERENMQAEILRFEDMKFTQEHCDLYDENEALKQWLKRLNADLEYEKNWGKIQAKQAEKDTAKEILDDLRDIFIEQSSYGCDINEHIAYYDYELKIGLVIEQIEEYAKEKYSIEYGVEVE